MVPVFVGPDRVMYTALFIIVAILFAVALVVFSQLKPKQEQAIATQ